MAGTPRYKIYSADGEYLAACKRAEEAAAVVAFLGTGATIRDGHKTILWTEGTDGIAAESYDFVADRVYSRCRGVFEV